MRQPPAQTWLVLGASSAIGRAFAREAARRGADVIVAGRDLADLARTAADVHASTGRSAASLSFDALDNARHADIAAALANTPGILNVALLFGIMPEQADIDANPALGLNMIAANLTGAISILHHLAPLLESRGAGCVVGFGSVAGDRGRIKNYVYGATKAGLHTYLAGLRNRLGRSGVQVLTVKPGFVDTAMTFGLPGLFLVASPDAVASSVLDAVRTGRDVVYVPFFWQFIMLIIKHVPEKIFKKLSI